MDWDEVEAELAKSKKSKKEKKKKKDKKKRKSRVQQTSRHMNLGCSVIDVAKSQL